jgi:hypothetical protein
MDYQELLKKVSEYVVQLYLQKPDDRLYFHNLSHKLKILGYLNKIQAEYKLDEKTYFNICSAVWFYDMGIVFGTFGAYQLLSAEIALQFLEELGVPKDQIEEIITYISLTKAPESDHSLAEKVFYDAIHFNQGLPIFAQDNRLLKKETESFTNKKIKGADWRAASIAILENFHYCTDYCQKLLSVSMQDNLNKLREKQEEKKWDSHPANIKLDQTKPNQTGNISGNNSRKMKNHLRAVETMFKNSSSGHQRLSVMADNKAFIMISVNSIIISVALGLIIGKFVLDRKLIVPTILLLSVNVITIIYSVLATRPRVMSGTFTKEDVHEKKVNLLFFGSFYKMPLKDFEYGIRHMMDDSDFLYKSLIKDIYWQGRVLGRKFKLLRISYDIFMYGTALSVVAYILSSIF